MTRRIPCIKRSGFDARESTIRSELKARLDAVKPIGTPPAGTDVWDQVLPIGSKLVVTELRPVVREHLGALFPLKFVRNGGYESPEEVLEHLIPQLRKWCPADAAMHIEGSANGTVAAPVVHREAGDGR